MNQRSAEKIVVIGLGKTGKSCVRFLQGRGHNVIAMDTRLNPPNYENIAKEFPGLKVVLGGLDADILCTASEIILSPGVSLQEPALQQAQSAGVNIISDISLFRRHVKKPIVAITGSNAKTTVTSLVGKLLQDAGMSVMVAGNIGIPVLELLNQGIEPDVYVLELSSFQLETTRNLNATVATILNVSEDHMDRYKNLDEYAAAKQYIYEGCETAVINKDDAYTKPLSPVKNSLFFHGSAPAEYEFGLIKKGTDIWLANDHNPIVKAGDLKIKGRHNQLNALAAVAIGKAMGLALESMLLSLTEFAGLTHRCQSAANIQGVEWINDSKGTNVGATQAAITGIGAELTGKVVLIAGGESKGADFTKMADTVKQYVKQIVLIGKDANLIANALGSYVDCETVDSLEAAMAMAELKAHKGDAVLFSPACASFDMFRDYEDRGDQFLKLVETMEVRA